MKYRSFEGIIALMYYGASYYDSDMLGRLGRPSMSALIRRLQHLRSLNTE